jgi:hypothetical protein
MEKVQKPSNSECCTPSSESFRLYKYYVEFCWTFCLHASYEIYLLLSVSTGFLPVGQSAYVFKVKCAWSYTSTSPYVFPGSYLGKFQGPQAGFQYFLDNPLIGKSACYRLVPYFGKKLKYAYAIPILCVWIPTLLTFECLNQYLWNLLCITCTSAHIEGVLHRSLNSDYRLMSILIVARRRFGKHVSAATNTRNNRIIVAWAYLWVCLCIPLSSIGKNSVKKNFRRVIFYADPFIAKERRQLVLPEFLVNSSGTNHLQGAHSYHWRELGLPSWGSRSAHKHVLKPGKATVILALKNPEDNIFIALNSWP